METSAFVAITAANKQDLELILSTTIDELCEKHAEVQRDLMQERREAAFIRFCNTGKFE